MLCFYFSPISRAQKTPLLGGCFKLGDGVGGRVVWHSLFANHMFWGESRAELDSHLLDLEGKKKKKKKKEKDIAEQELLKKKKKKRIEQNRNCLVSLLQNFMSAEFVLHMWNWKDFEELLCVSPWFNHNGWLGVKHQVTYILTSVCVCWRVFYFTFQWIRAAQRDPCQNCRQHRTYLLVDLTRFWCLLGTDCVHVCVCVVCEYGYSYILAKRVGSLNPWFSYLWNWS